MTLYLLSDELCAFMGLPCGSRRTEVDVQIYLLHYIECIGESWNTGKEICELLSQCDWSIDDVDSKLRTHFMRSF